jgi:UDP-N-acetylmuramoylalanine--D-glutamate ligase
VNDARAFAPAAHRALAGQRVVVMGLGSFGGGAGAARYLAQLGAHVRVTDQRSAVDLRGSLTSLADLPLEYTLGGHRPEDFRSAEWVVVNPAVRPSDPLLTIAREGGARLTSEIELFLEAVPARVVAITGTQGKSSSTHMTHALLAGAGFRAHRGGNIGGSLLPLLGEIGREDVVVLELSSYQLELLSGRPTAARIEAVAVVNILADHLERHGSLEAYVAAKRRILELLVPGGFALLPREDARLAGWPVNGRKLLFGAADAGDGLFLRAGEFRAGTECLGRIEDLALPGAFQRSNALVALGLARCLGATPERLAATLPDIRGLEHRLQDLGTFHGHRVIDNAVSTTPDSTLSALEALAPGVVLLLGGKAKRLPLDELARAARTRVSLAIAFGQAGPDFATALRAEGVPVEVVPSVEAAVALALERGTPGCEVLFSPAAASFDAYANFEERATAFRRTLEALR